MHIMLTSVAVVCHARPDVGMIDGVARIIDGFVDPAPLWTLLRAYQQSLPGYLRLMKRVAAVEPKNIEPALKQHNFSRTLYFAVCHGNVPIVEWLVVDYYSTGVLREPVRMAAERGQLEILRWLLKNHESRLVWTPRELTKAADNNHWRVVRWLHDTVPTFERAVVNNVQSLLQYAARDGNLEMVKWIDDIQEGVPNDLPARVWGHLSLAQVETLLVVAAGRGQIPVMKYIKTRSGVQYHRACLVSAVRGSQLEAAQWLHTEGHLTRINADDLYDVARSGNAKVILWAVRNLELEQLRNLPTVIRAAATRGHLATVKCLFECDPDLGSTGALDCAAVSGRLEMVKWLHENRNERCTTDATNGAALNGYLDMLKWLHENRPTAFSRGAMDRAVKRNRLAIVQWLHEIGAGCTTDAMDSAAKQNYLDILRWLHEHGAGCTVNAMDGAAEANHLEVVKWLHDNRQEGCTANAMDRAAREGHLEMVQWLHANRTEGCTTAAMDSAASYGRLKVVEWLHENREEGCTARAMRDAVSNGHLAVVQWLCEHRGEGLYPEAFASAFSNSRKEIIKWLHTTKPEMFNELLTGSRTIIRDLELLVTLGVRPSPECVYFWAMSAMRTRNYEVFEWLVSKFEINAPEAGERDPAEASLYADPYIQDILRRQSL